MDEIYSLIADLNRFLRRVLSGLVYVFLVFPLILQNIHFCANYCVDVNVSVSFLLIVGVIVGEIIYEIYHASYGALAWWSERFRRCWGLDYIKSLRDLGKRIGECLGETPCDRQLRASWESIYFKGQGGEVSKRADNQFSLAHSSGTTAISILIAVMTWLVFSYSSVCSDWRVFAVLVFVACLLLLSGIRSLREAGALSDVLFLEYYDELKHALEVSTKKKQAKNSI